MRAKPTKFTSSIKPQLMKASQSFKNGERFRLMLVKFVKIFHLML